MVPVTRIVATSWKYSPNLSNNLFFAMVDFDEGQEAFQIMKLNHAPCKEQTMDTLMHRFFVYCCKRQNRRRQDVTFLQCDQIRRFFTVIGSKVPGKSSPNI